MGLGPSRESSWHDRENSAVNSSHRNQQVKRVCIAQSCQQNLLSTYAPASNSQPEPDFLELSFVINVSTLFSSSKLSLAN